MPRIHRKQVESLGQGVSDNWFALKIMLTFQRILAILLWKPLSTFDAI